MDAATPEINDRNCRECGKPLGAGRSDRKYCDDICRTAYNNRRRADGVLEPARDHQSDPAQQQTERDLEAIRKVYSILLDNRNKLSKMFDHHGYQLTLDEFNRFGINLKYFTSTYIHEERARIFKMCFDYGYDINDNHVWLVHNPGEILYN